MLKSKSVVLGKSSESELIERLTSDDPEFRMPSKGPALKPEEVQRFRAWIDRGASWEPGFSFKGRTYVAPFKLRRPELPPVQAGHDHPIDRFIDAYYVKKNVVPPDSVDDATFARRLFLDVIGLPHLPDELQHVSELDGQECPQNAIA